MPLIQNQGKWELLFIRRTKVDDDQHSGQVAFPGGRADKEDKNPVETALRETQEEIGVQESAIEILGQLEYMITISNYKVTPIIGEMQWPIDLHAQATEVERIFSIP
jgi:8-oxo-dGTP pyrophosphatase MutT (NUDIX family)